MVGVRRGARAGRGAALAFEAATPGGARGAVAGAAWRARVPVGALLRGSLRQMSMRAAAKAHCETTLLALVTGELKWDIKGVSKQALAAWQNGEGKRKGELFSSVFSVGGVEWRASAFPNGSNEEDRGHVSAYLEIMTPNKPVDVTFSLTVGGVKEGPGTKKFGRGSAEKKLEGCESTNGG